MERATLGPAGRSLEQEERRAQGGKIRAQLLLKNGGVKKLTNHPGRMKRRSETIVSWLVKKRRVSLPARVIKEGEKEGGRILERKRAKKEMWAEGAAARKRSRLEVQKKEIWLDNLRSKG